MNKEITPQDLKRAIVCADWISNYKNSLAAETSNLLIKMVTDFNRLLDMQKTNNLLLKHYAYEDLAREEAVKGFYDCGEL